MKFEYKTTLEKLQEGKSMIVKNGGEIYNDGTFEVSGVEGKISFSNEKLQVNITDKPWLASWDMIESKLNEFFN